jgi:hypothetical protein
MEFRTMDKIQKPSSNESYVESVNAFAMELLVV